MGPERGVELLLEKGGKTNLPDDPPWPAMQIRPPLHGPVVRALMASRGVDRVVAMTVNITRLDSHQESQQKVGIS